MSGLSTSNFVFVFEGVIPFVFMDETEHGVFADVMVLNVNI